MQKAIRPLALIGALLLASASARAQQVRFSIDGPSASTGAFGPGGAVIEPGSVLYPDVEPLILGPLNLPWTLFLPGALGLGFSPWEVDAMSHGRDARPNSAAGIGLDLGQLLFSVDRQSRGRVAADDVRQERPQSASDMFLNVALMPVPADDLVVTGHALMIDGDGQAHPSTGRTSPGLGVVEPGDQLDGFDQVKGVGGGLNQLFYSLNPGSSVAHGFNPADVILSNLAGWNVVYAPAAALGLDQFGPGSDDIDALAVWDNGDGNYTQPNGEHFKWGPGNGDMILFSVSRGSAVVGQPDSQFGILIQPGDVLTLPLGGGVSPFPAMVVAAERISLRADRVGAGVSVDNLNALDIAYAGLALVDCNGNGVEDSIDIASGAFPDVNLNGIPDGCEALVPSNYCTAGISAAGCQATLSAVGSPSVTAGSGFTVTATNVDGDSGASLFFFGVAGRSATPWGCSTGYKCVASPVVRTAKQDTVGWGTSGLCDIVVSEDIAARWAAKPAGAPSAGAVVDLQYFYRDPMRTCGTTTNMSDALEFTALP